MRLKLGGCRGRALLALPVLAGCSGAQSALDPAGFEADAVARLFWIMLGAAALLWVAVLGLARYAARPRQEPWRHRSAGRLILWCGAIGPTLLLCGLLVHSLLLMPALRAPGGPLRVEVQGEQFWWRVRYHPPGGGPPVESANALRLPVGQRVELRLTSPDVIHSFWVPALAGKMDMIPGRTNRLVLEPSRTGLFRGACAEFCGASHALMAFTVEVMEPAAFQRWLAEEGRPAAAPAGEGAALFLKNGCGACHTVRGTPAAGRVGPDLTHLASRPTLGAGILDNTRANREHFITHPREIKPSALMPGFGMLPEGEIAAIAAWLGRLQ
ncbi:cytochrome c oxidase subunit II [Roseomonas sp. M0104]|uniref:Cytochrome aa3 subunit 2 n=1 Tax=Teichococcus coralli TaxID=2545983 RepID=A0A845BE45_9PROT|nr:cytochrome c oxidase subunit II [Pseudoroseomonas coralli]MXP64396.1 cytochrome c oxidase subunit II [Pseudoroseomonas coralli]